MSSVIKKQDNTKKLLNDLQRKQVQFVTLGGQLIRTEQVARCPKKTGNLANSIQVETFVKEGIASSETAPTVEYAVFIERGTGIYAVKGDGRKKPWWYKTEDGRWFWTQGAKAQPFMEPGYQAAKPKIDALSKRIFQL